MYFSELFKTVVYQFKMNISADILETDLLCTCVSSIMQSPPLWLSGETQMKSEQEHFEIWGGQNSGCLLNDTQYFAA